MKKTFNNADYYVNGYTGEEGQLDDMHCPAHEVTAVHSKLLLSDAHGIYIPKVFCENFDLTKWKDISTDDMTCCLLGPGQDNEWYWEAWASICQSAWYQDEEGNKWVLEQDGDLFAKCYIDYTNDEEQDNGQD